MKKPNSNMPRAIFLRMILGDEEYEYIKDEIGVENFLQKAFLEEDRVKENFLTDENVKSFLSHWILIVEHYKKKFGKHIRDKDAIENLKTEEDFKHIDELYKFRCKLVKSDFTYNDDFKKDLSSNLKKLLNLVSILKKEKEGKNQYLINNTIW